MTREVQNSFPSNDLTFKHPHSFLQTARIIQDWLPYWSLPITERQIIHTQ